MRVAVLFLALSIPAFAAEHTLQLTPENTKIEWTLGDVLHTVHGTFKLKRGSITFDPDTNKASGEVVVDVASGDSGSGLRDKRMHSNILESSKYPDAVFTPDHIDSKLSALHGTLRIHGASHEITMKVQAATGDITFEIPYVAWGMKDPSTFILKVEKTVAVAIHTTVRVSP